MKIKQKIIHNEYREIAKRRYNNEKKNLRR